MLTIQPGQTIEVQNYPFCRETFVGHDAGGPFSDECWRPGCDKDTDEFDHYTYAADATGHMLLTIVSTHKPGRYQERVFYTRQWRDPDGKVFGSPKLRVTSANAFKRLAKGYRHSFHNADTGEDVRP